MSGIQYKSPRKGIADRTQQFAAHKSSHHGRVTKISERKARKPCPPPSNTPAEVLAMVQLKLREAEGGTEVFDNGFVSYAALGGQSVNSFKFCMVNALVRQVPSVADP